MNIPVRNRDGDTVDTINLNDAVFNVPMNPSLVHQALVIYQTNKRQGTHSTKTRAEVSGGGRKPWIQKHTGRARQGSIRSPQWRHGGIVFGPKPRDYRKALPRRMRRQALKCVLSDKARQERLICLESWDGVDGKTKSMAELLQNLEVSGSALMVTLDPEENVVRAAHNLGKVWTLPVNLLNAHELLRRETVIMTVDAARWAEEFLSAPVRRRVGAAVEETPDDDEAEEPASEQVAPEASVEEARAEQATEETTEDAGGAADEAVETPVDEEAVGDASEAAPEEQAGADDADEEAQQ